MKKPLTPEAVLRALKTKHAQLVQQFKNEREQQSRAVLQLEIEEIVSNIVNLENQIR